MEANQLSGHQTAPFIGRTRRDRPVLPAYRLSGLSAIDNDNDTIIGTR